MSVAAADPALDALRALTTLIERNDERFRSVVQRAAKIETLRSQGYTWRQIMATEERPLIIDMLNQSMALLNEVGGRLRREEARLMFQEGAKRQEIADTFGITEDHVDAMLGGIES